MSCSPFDLRDYLFGELGEAQRRQVDQHVRSCGGCHEEMERLRVTQSTLLALPEEEVPQRIGFVSDPVFEPSGARRVWRAFWGSAPRLGFASAAMLSAALVVFALTRPAAPAPVVTTAQDTAKIEQQVSGQVGAAVQKAVAASEARQEKKTRELLVAAEERFQQQHASDMARVGAAYSYLEKKYSVLEHATYETAGLR
jgi:anti-sigma factor RsiW